jgi:predicted phosphodiesterase
MGELETEQRTTHKILNAQTFQEKQQFYAIGHTHEQQAEAA